MGFMYSVKDFLGIGRGKIKLQLSKINFSPGEAVTGNVILSLKEPVQAEELSVDVNGILIVTQNVTRQVQGRTVTRPQSVNYPLFNFKLRLDGEKVYPQGENAASYPFSITIPADVYAKNSTDGAGTFQKIMQSLSKQYQRTDWRVQARLSVKGIDTTDVVQINVA